MFSAWVLHFANTRKITNKLCRKLQISYLLSVEKNKRWNGHLSLNAGVLCATTTDISRRRVEGSTKVLWFQSWSIMPCYTILKAMMGSKLRPSAWNRIRFGITWTPFKGNPRLLRSHSVSILQAVKYRTKVTGPRELTWTIFSVKINLGA